MRLQLIAVAIVWPRLAAAQVAEHEPGSGAVDSSVGVYTDSDRTTVVTSVVQANVRLPVPVDVAVHALVDAVTSASVDVVSAATSRFSENRVEVGSTAAIGLSASTEATVGYTHSGENDWRSHAIELGLSRELAHKNAKLTLGYGFTTNDIGRAHDPGFERHLDVHGAQLGIAQVLGPKTLATIAYTLSFADGYQGSPYRFITTMDGFSAPESPPESRVRHAATGRLMQTIGRANVVDLRYRFYADDWGIRSHTVELAYTRALDDRWSVRLRTRGYHQDGAAFYREVYDMPMRYMTVDRELSTFWDGLVGIKLGRSTDTVDLDIKTDAIVYRFEDYARLRGRVAIVSAVGATWRW